MRPAQPDQQHPFLEEIVASALLHLRELGYSERTRKNYERVWQAFLGFCRGKRDHPYLAPRLAAHFLRHRGIVQRLATGEPLSWSQQEIRRGLRILLDFQATGAFRRHRKRSLDARLPGALRRELDRHEEFCARHLHHRASTLSMRRFGLTRFIAFLASQGITRPDRLQPSSVSAFLVSRSRQVQPRSLSTEVGHIRSFLRFLCMEGFAAPELLTHARALRFAREHRLPPVWPAATVEAVLSAVDRSSPVGKRDYAILLLACRLGLRASDIRTLRLDDICWGEACISITQQKTGRSLSLPLSDEIGQALIDYLKHGRPDARHREVFLKTRAPFEPLGPHNSMHGVMDTALHRAEVYLAPGLPRGLHALRHTLATRLVQAGEPLESVGGILGHRSIESTRLYTHLDVEALRSVALDPEEVLHD